MKRWKASGCLRVLHPGVYSPGHALLGPRGRWLAGAKAIDGMLSHWSAAQHWRYGDDGGVTHVTTTGRHGPRAGLSIHYTTRLDVADHTVHRGIPVTTPTRTLIDIAGTASPAELLRCVERMSSLDLGALDRTLRRTPGRHGVAPLHAMCRLRGPHLRSHLERLFLKLCHDLPKPLTNQWVDGKQVDFLWPEHRLVVETDGWASHRDRAQFANDRKRDIELMRAGFAVARFTYDRVAVHPKGVREDLAALLLRPPR